MSKAELVANHEGAKTLCKRLAGDNWRELYNVSWLAFREAELRGKAKCDDAVNYFYRVIWSKNYQYHRDNQKSKLIYNEKALRLYCDEEPSDSKEFDRHEELEEIIKKYLSKDYKDELNQFYQDFCRALLGFQDIKIAQRQMGICRTTFWKLLKQLRGVLKLEEQKHQKTK